MWLVDRGSDVEEYYVAIALYYYVQFRVFSIRLKKTLNYQSQTKYSKAPLTTKLKQTNK